MLGQTLSALEKCVSVSYVALLSLWAIGGNGDVFGSDLGAGVDRHSVGVEISCLWAESELS